MANYISTWATTDPNVNNPFEQNTLENFNFAVAGDFGCDNNVNQTIASMLKRDPELVIALGDLSYSKSPQCWLDIVRPLDNGSRIKISIGEHDIKNKLILYSEYMKHFNLVKPFYSFDYRNVHFLAMATAKNRIIPYNLSSEQYRFVKDDLEKAHSNKNIDWIIVYQFREFYSSLSVHPGLDELQEAYHPLLEKYGVDLVFQAHNHNYQRTYPIAFNETSSSHPIVTSREPANYDNHIHGQIFLTVGTAGKGEHGLLGKAPFVVRQFQGHGFFNVDITDNGKKLVGSFYDNTDANILDQFSITK
jgi:Calcineurin-like phosphoesterase